MILLVFAVALAIVAVVSFKVGYSGGYGDGRLDELRREMAERRDADIDALRKAVFDE